jgi:tRNA pseudouridine38-40 synthase
MRNLKLITEYDGSEFLGWQTQPTGRTVQGEITRVLMQVLQEQVSLIGAGRTDTGVHARGQVANFRTDSRMTTELLLKALNGMLPADIVVHSVEEVPEHFHARFDARERVYRYFISCKQRAIGRAYLWYVPYHLDFDVMQSVARCVKGGHDFEQFSKNGSETKDFRCDVRNSFWTQNGDHLVYEIRSNRFLRGMIRLLVGTMVDVGRGYQTVDGFRQVFEQGGRADVGMAAPPHGLFLEEVCY